MKNVENKGKQISTISFVAITIVALILLNKLVGIPFWLMLAIIFLFFIINLIATGEKKSPRSAGLACVFVFILVFSFANSYWEANYPRSFKNSEILKARIDQTISRGMGDKVDVQAEDIWQTQRAVAAKRFLRRYNELLADERPSEAKDLEKKFHEIWGPDKEEEQKATTEETVTTPSSEPIILSNEIKVFNLKSGEETPWLGTEDCKITDLSFSSPTYDYKIIVSDNTEYKGEKNATVPLKEHCYYKIKANSNQFVTVTAKTRS